MEIRSNYYEGWQEGITAFILQGLKHLPNDKYVEFINRLVKELQEEVNNIDEGRYGY